MLVMVYFGLRCYIEGPGKKTQYLRVYTGRLRGDMLPNHTGFYVT